MIARQLIGMGIAVAGLAQCSPALASMKTVSRMDAAADNLDFSARALDFIRNILGPAQVLVGVPSKDAAKEMAAGVAEEIVRERVTPAELEGKLHVNDPALVAKTISDLRAAQDVFDANSRMGTDFEANMAELMRQQNCRLNGTDCEGVDLGNLGVHAVKIAPCSEAVRTYICNPLNTTYAGLRVRPLQSYQNECAILNGRMLYDSPENAYLGTYNCKVSGGTMKADMLSKFSMSSRKSRFPVVNEGGGVISYAGDAFVSPCVPCDQPRLLRR